MDLTLETKTEYCVNCGCLMIIPLEIQKDLKASKRIFYCLNGHGQSYAKTTSQILQEEKDRLERKIYDLNQEVYRLKYPPFKPTRKAKRTTEGAKDKQLNSGE